MHVMRDISTWKKCDGLWAKGRKRRGRAARARMAITHSSSAAGLGAFGGQCSAAVAACGPLPCVCAHVRMPCCIRQGVAGLLGPGLSTPPKGGTRAPDGGNPTHGWAFLCVLCTVPCCAPQSRRGHALSGQRGDSGWHEVCTKRSFACLAHLLLALHLRPLRLHVRQQLGCLRGA